MSIATQQRAAAASADVAALQAICGAEHVVVAEDERRFFSQDLYRAGRTCAAVVRPGSVDEVREVVRRCAADGVAVFNRGGGMSYTDAFQPTRTPAITLDLSRLAAIREINVEDGYVTVEAGCTWAALDAALAPHGVRAAFWGPMSGARATIGGGLSQGSITFGSGAVGASANAVMGFEIVAGDGRLIRTGSDGQAGFTPFNRHYGPDLTGLFANDAGALGVKTAATLALEPRAPVVGGVAFAFDAFEPMAEVLTAVTRARLASEMMAMDADVARQNAGPGGLAADMKTAWTVVKAARNPLRGAARVARMAQAGRGFFEKSLYTANFVVEAHSQREYDLRVDRIRALADGKGVETANSAVLVLRASPFPELPVLHPDGRRLLPMHGVLPPSKVKAFHAAFLKMCDDHRTQMDETSVTIASFFTGIPNSGVLYEPVFYWPDAQDIYHARMTPEMFKGMGQTYPENLKGRALVETLKQGAVDLMHAHGATHFQIGRMYPYLRGREPGALSLLHALKAELAPDGILNPGALGL